MQISTTITGVSVGLTLRSDHQPLHMYNEIQIGGSHHGVDDTKVSCVLFCFEYPRRQIGPSLEIKGGVISKMTPP